VVVLLEDRAYEFHVDARVTSAGADLRAQMKSLRARVMFKSAAKK
jgi:hypothetical protein